MAALRGYLLCYYPACGNANLLPVKMNKETVGYISSGIATITLAEVNLWFGLAVAVVSLLCLLPSAVLNWRKFLYDYQEYKTDLRVSGFWAFAYFCIGRLSKSAVKNDKAA